MQIPWRWLLVSWLALGLAQVSAQNPASVQSVARAQGKTIGYAGGKWVTLTLPVEFPRQITVLTNGIFKVGSGKPRELGEGQTLHADGMLLSSDGSLMPVFDHYVIQKGVLVLVRDGQASPVDKEIPLPKNEKVTPDGRVYRSNGNIARLMDGQMLDLQGQVIPAKDTVTLRQGKVTVQKDGALLAVPPNQTLMMSDGTKVLGTGAIITQDGQRTPLVEGQTLILQGAVVAPR